jgi:hypothetical protein
MDGFDGFDSSTVHLCGSRSHSNGIALKKSKDIILNLESCISEKTTFQGDFENFKQCNAIKKNKKNKGLFMFSFVGFPRFFPNHNPAQLPKQNMDIFVKEVFPFLTQ